MQKLHNESLGQMQKSNENLEKMQRLVKEFIIGGQVFESKEELTEGNVFETKEDWTEGLDSHEPNAATTVSTTVIMLISMVILFFLHHSFYPYSVLVIFLDQFFVPQYNGYQGRAVHGVLPCRQVH